MFNSRVEYTPFTTADADASFSNIEGANWNDDVSFVSTLRALVAPRIAENERVFVSVGSYSYDGYNVTGSEETAIRNIKSVYNPCHQDKGVIRILNFKNASHESNEAWFNAYEKYFEKAFDDWYRIGKVTDFFVKAFPVMCFANPETKQVVILVEKLDLRKYHYLQCAIFAFLPWYFNPEDGVSELEMNLIKSLREKSEEAYIKCLKDIASKYDFRTIKINRLLSGFETRFDRDECTRLKRVINDKTDDANELNRRIGEIFNEIRTLEINVLGLEQKIAQGGTESEIRDFFLANKKIDLIHVSDASIDFIVKDYLEIFDEDMADRYISNENSSIYHPAGYNGADRIPKDDMEMLMRAIFDSQILKVRFCAAYSFSLTGNVAPISEYYFPDDCSDYMPNPHIQHYGCMGNYVRIINEMLQRHDYVGVIVQTMASCKSLNFADGTVFTRFMEDIYGYRVSNRKCIELPDGNVVEPEAAITWLKTQEGSDE